MILNPQVLKFLAARASQVRASAPDSAHPVVSPCTSVCQIDTLTGLCEGCLRTMDEIGCWSSADEGFKRVVWSRIEARLAQCEVT
ncbi:MAG: hypothetical protein RL300_262 [Pseudomonadota bacterium]